MIDYKIYNPHCSKWGDCKERLNTCMGCLNYKKGSMILFNKIFDEKLKGLINDLGDNDWLNINKYNIMILNDFISGYNEFESLLCEFGESSCSCGYDGTGYSCLKHYLEYYVKNNLEEVEE